MKCEKFKQVDEGICCWFTFSPCPYWRLWASVGDGDVVSLNELSSAQ